MNVSTPVAERPLSRTAFLLLVLSTTGVMALFYLACLVSLLLIAALLLVEMLVLLALARFGGAGLMVGPIRAMVGLASLVLRSLNLQRGPDYFMPLQRADAPRLYEQVERLAARVDVRPPDRTVLEMEANAWVHLRGYRKGRGRSTLGVGFDLLAVLAEDEIEAVLAHELAHAKLVQRGYKGWLANGVGRMGRLAVALNELSAAARAQKGRFRTAELLAAGAGVYGRIGSRLVAAYSRQHEFAADRLAAQVCGADAGRRALMKIHVAGQRGRGLSWRDRLVQLGREESVSQWLRERLTPRNDEERLELEQQAVNETRRREFSTHPSLADRLAALPADHAPGTPSPPALGLLRNPDEVAARLLAELERIAHREERRDSERLRGVIRRRVRGRQNTPGQYVGVILMLAAFAFGMMAVAGPWNGWADLSDLLLFAGLAVALGGVGGVVYRRSGFRERIVLPVPPVARWREAMESPVRGQRVDSWWSGMEAEVTALLPPDLRSRRAHARFWGGQCYRFLERCDFQRAWVAAHLGRLAAPRSLENALGESVAAAYFGMRLRVDPLLGWTVGEYGLGASVSWAAGWSLAMLGNWAGAEPYLLDAATRRPGEATVRSLLGLCHWHQGKMREAAQNARQAIALEPEEPRHRLLLARVLLAAGRAKEALRELEAVVGETAHEFDAMLAGVSANLLLGRSEEAECRIALLEQQHPGPLTLLRLGQIHADADQHERARPYFAQACDQAFYPEAHLGLARSAYDSKQKDEARAHLLAALDVTRELGPGAGHPLAQFERVMRGLASLSEPAHGCQAWTASVDLSDSPAQANRLALLVAAPTPEQAQAQVREIYHAMHPDRDPAAARITWEPVERAGQPEGPVSPGVYGHRIE